MNIGLALFGLAVALNGLNWAVHHRAWAQKASKSPSPARRKFLEIFFLVIGVFLVLAGIALMLGGIFGSS